MRETNFSGIPFTDAGGKTEQTKEPEAAPAAETEKKEQPGGKKVFSKSPEMNLWYLSASISECELQSYNLLSPLQEDTPVGEDGSEDSGSEEDDSDDDSDEDSNESSEDEDDDEDEQEKEDEPLSLEWPETWRKQATYLLLLPIIFPLWLTVPDVRNQVKTHTLN